MPRATQASTIRDRGRPAADVLEGNIVVGIRDRVETRWPRHAASAPNAVQQFEVDVIAVAASRRGTISYNRVVSPATEDLVTRARRYASAAHRRIDHRRKYDSRPYEVHLKSVAQLVAAVTDDPEMIAAAWLHDTVEDTPVTLDEIRERFGAGVADLVSDLTDVSVPGDGNRATRKAIDRAHTARASSRAKTVKLADLLDNCRDIRRGDARFAKVFAVEASALLDVLHDGDPRLRRRLEQELAEILGEPARALPFDPEAQAPARERSFGQQRTIRLFMEGITARELAEPMLWFEADSSGAEVARALASQGAALAGVRRDGLPVGYVRAERLDDAPCGTAMKPFLRGQVLSGDAPITDVIHVLTRHDLCCITLLGQVSGVIARTHLNGPVARMWLFGLITLIELRLTERIRRLWPGERWHAQLSASRLQKARALADERLRRGQPVELLDCLQFADKAQVLLSDAQQRALLGFETKGVASQTIRDLESLRNNLAHAQDIVTHDWHVVARMAMRLEEVLDAFE